MHQQIWTKQKGDLYISVEQKFLEMLHTFWLNDINCL